MKAVWWLISMKYCRVWLWYRIWNCVEDLLSNSLLHIYVVNYGFSSINFKNSLASIFPSPFVSRASKRAFTRSGFVSKCSSWNSWNLKKKCWNDKYVLVYLHCAFHLIEVDESISISIKQLKCLNNHTIITLIFSFLDFSVLFFFLMA